MWGSKDASLQVKPAKTSRELHNAIAEDLRKEQINDAKIKAMTDIVDYDTFKARVSVAHLRPIGAPNLKPDVSCSPASLMLGVPGVATVSSSTVSGTSTSTTSAGTPSSSSSSSSGTGTLPTTTSAFQREWRGKSSEERFNLLSQLPPASISHIFKVEVPPALLGEMLETWNLHCCPTQPPSSQEVEAAGIVVKSLEALTGAGRFTLTCKLLSAKAKTAVTSLCDRLEALCSNDSDMSPTFTRETVQDIRSKCT